MLVPFSFMKTVPVVPVATAATGVGETSFTANWNAFTGATYYLLDVSTSPSFSSFVLQDEFTTSTSYVVIGLTASTTYYYRVRANVGVDPDAQAFFDRVTTAGGTLSATEQTATNQLVLDMKAAGIWTKMKAVYPMVGASAAACAQNLKSSSFTGTFTSGWTFASTGVTPNGTSAYMDTGLNPNTQLTANNLHLSFYSRTQNSTAGYDMAQEGVTLDIICSYLGSTGYFGYDTLYSYSNTDSRGFYLASRSSSTFKGYRNNVIKINVSPTTPTFSSNSILIGAYHPGPLDYSTKQSAFASIGDGLTDTQASNFYTAVQNFNQTLNRQVGAQVVSDADAQAYINRVYTAGGTLTNTEANAVNQLTIDMKAAGIWTAMKAVYPMVGSSAAACAQNLKSSSFTGTFSSGWTFSSTGATPNGTSAYMNTQFIPSSNVTLNNAHLSYYSRTNVVGVQVDIGSIGGSTNAFYLIMNLNNIAPSGINAPETSRASAMSPTLGFLIGSRITSTEEKYYTNNVSQTLTKNSDSMNSLNVYLGCFNQSGTANLFSTKETAFASLGDGLTDTQAADFYTCVNTFQVSLSRNV